jgi:hypothetical protein
MWLWNAMNAPLLPRRIRTKLSLESWAHALWTSAEGYCQKYKFFPTADDQATARSIFAPNGFITKLIHCPRCVEHYNNYATLNPPDVSSREALITWMLGVHNSVNAKKHREDPSIPLVVYTYEQVCEDYRGPFWRVLMATEKATEKLENERRVNPMAPTPILTDDDIEKPKPAYHKVTLDFFLRVLILVVSILLLVGLVWGCYELSQFVN